LQGNINHMCTIKITCNVLNVIKHTFWSIPVMALAILLATISCKGNGDGNETGSDDLGFSKMDSITLQLEEIKVLFPTVEQWEERGAIQFKSDSAIIYDKFSEMLMGKSFTINIDATKELIVEQQYETQLCIITQDGDLILDKLNKYVSPWMPIVTQKGNNKYTKPEYTPEDIRRFPETSINQVLEYLFWETRTTQSEFDWTKYLKQAKTIQDFPFKISIKKTTLRFRGTYVTGKSFEKYIVFYLG
jgi:hypothetical protein